MKTNVDLTESQMFSGISHNIRIGNKNISWRTMEDLYGSTLSEEYENLPLVFVGNKEDRELQKLSEEECSHNYCDRCGKELTKVIWRRSNCLCKKCNDILDKQLNIKKIPWNDLDNKYYYMNFEPKLFWR